MARSRERFPAGLPARLTVGLLEDLPRTWMRDSGVAWDLRCWVNNWGWGPADGAFVMEYMQQCDAQGFIPTLEFYQLLGEPGGGEEAVLAKARNASSMSSREAGWPSPRAPPRPRRARRMPRRRSSPARPCSVTFRLWVPPGHRISGVQPFVQEDGAGAWRWTDKWYSSSALVTGAWNTLTVQVPTDAVVPLHRLGLKLYTEAIWTDTIAVDSVSW